MRNVVQKIRVNKHHSVPTTDLGKAASSVEGEPPRYSPCRELPLPKRGHIYNVPVEVLIGILQLVAPLCTRNGLYNLVKLTHVCRFWREALINQPRLWSAVFIKQRDRRSFVEACLERSHPVTLDVVVDARKWGKVKSDCTCHKKPRERLLPRDSNPCEWHFQFELLAETKHSNRIRALNIEFDSESEFDAKEAQLMLGSCRFFTSTFPKLVALTWKNPGTDDADYLFSTPPFVPTLRSLTYAGEWNSLITQAANLTSFSLDICFSIETEAFRLFMCNNLSLESLDLWIELKGDSEGPPAHLLKLKSLTVTCPPKNLSTTIRIPAFQRLSSLHISSGDYDPHKLYATGDDITLTTECYPDSFAETWEELTGYAKPIIRHVRLHDEYGFDHEANDNNTLAVLMMDAQTLEVGARHLHGWYNGFWDDLKQLGAQLKTIRFEVSEDMDPCDCKMLDPIADLVKYRFQQGRPFSVVERFVVSEDDKENRLQAYVWRYFYGNRKLGQYVRPLQV